MRTSPGPAPWDYGPRPTASPPSTTSATARSSVGRIEVVENAHRLGEQGVVAARLLLDPAQHGLETSGVGHRYAADVEKVHRGADRCERGVLVQPEARGEHLEGHAVLHVRELRAVEVEADGVLRTFAWPRDPDEPGVAIDESLDEPRAREAVDPWGFASRPYALLETPGIDLAQSTLGKARFAASVQLAVSRLQRIERACGLGAGFAGEEIDLRELGHCALEAPDRRLAAPRSQGLERSLRRRDALDQGPVVRAAIEELADVRELRSRPRLQLGGHGEATLRPDVGLELGETARIGGGRQHVDAIAQHAAAGFLERAPKTHPQGGVPGRQAEHQGVEAFHCVICITNK